METEECAGEYKGRGMCRLHYDRWYYGAKQPKIFHGVTIPDPGARDRPAPNPWIEVAPSCPRCSSSEWVFLWANDDALRWFCQPCRRRFDVAEEVAA